MAQRKFGLNPVERAIAKQKWKEFLSTAQLHALIGGDIQSAIDRICTLFYIIGLAAYKQNLLTPEIRIIHGASRTALDVSFENSITEMQRGTLNSGLLAIERIKDSIKEKYLIEASIHTSLLLKQDGVYWRDFQVFVKE